MQVIERCIVLCELVCLIDLLYGLTYTSILVHRVPELPRAEGLIGHPTDTLIFPIFLRLTLQ